MSQSNFSLYPHRESLSFIESVLSEGNQIPDSILKKNNKKHNNLIITDMKRY